jgi:DNA transposition AAA+ family ATPase
MANTDDFLLTKSASIIFEKLDYCRKVTIDGGVPRCVLILGRSGVGKTTILKEYEHRNPAIKQGYIYKTPVLLSKISTTPNVIETIFQMLSDLAGEPVQRLTNPRTINKMLKGLLLKCETEILIIDVPQYLNKIYSDKEITKVFYWLKNFSMDVNMSLVISGPPWIESVVRGEEDIDSRNTQCIVIKPFTVKDAFDKKECCNVVSGLAKRLPFSKVPLLHKNEFLYPILAITDGNFRSLKWFLEEAVNAAKKEDSNSLEKKHFTAVLQNNDNFTCEMRDIFKYPTEDVVKFLTLKYEGASGKAIELLNINKKLLSTSAIPQIFSKR